MRNNEAFRRDAQHIQVTGDKKAADLTGISGLSILSELPSIDFPRSFPPDCMHLFYENVIPALVRHYRGVFFRRETSDDQETAKNDGPQIQQPRTAPGSSRRQRRTATNTRLKDQAPAPVVATGGMVANRGNQLPQMQKVKFKKTSDHWNIAPKVWERIGRDQKVCIYLPIILYNNPSQELCICIYICVCVCVYLID